MSIEDAIRAAVTEAMRPLEAKLDRLLVLANKAFDLNPERKLSGSEARRLARCRESELYAAAASGELAAEHRPGGRGGRGLWLFARADVIAWAEARRGAIVRENKRSALT